MTAVKRVSMLMGLVSVAALGAVLPAHAETTDLATLPTVEAEAVEQPVALELAQVQPGLTITEVLGQPGSAIAPATATPAEPTILAEAASLKEAQDSTVSTSAATLLQPAANEVAALPTATQASDEAISDGEVVAQGGPSAYQGVSPAYLGVGGNIGFGSDTIAIGDPGFVVVGKISLGPRFAFRPSATINRDTVTFGLPITYNFNPIGQVEGFRVAPFLGAGAAISTRGSVASFLINGGIDVPISREFTLTAQGNLALFNGTAFGLILGVAYNLPVLFD